MIGAIENAVVDLIASVNTPAVLGYRLKTVATYAGQFDGAAAVGVDYPAALVSFVSEARPEMLDMAEYKYSPVFTLFCAARNARNDKAARHGDGAAVGAFQIMEDMRALLMARRLGLDISPITPGRVVTLVNRQNKSNGLAILALEFHTQYVVSIPDDAAADNFATLHAAWDISPIGNIDDPTGAGDATDDIKGLDQ